MTRVMTARLDTCAVGALASLTMPITLRTVEMFDFNLAGEDEKDAWSILENVEGREPIQDGRRFCRCGGPTGE